MYPWRAVNAYSCSLYSKKIDTINKSIPSQVGLDGDFLFRAVKADALNVNALSTITNPPPAHISARRNKMLYNEKCYEKQARENKNRKPFVTPLLLVK
jgi:hypothetical protein